MSVAKKLYYRCTECRAKTSTTNRARAVLGVCVNCRPDLDAAPVRTKAAKTRAPRAAAPCARNGNSATPVAVAKSKPTAPEAIAPVIERAPETLAKIRALIGFPSADFEGFRRKGFAVGYFYEQPADAPGKKMAVEFTKRRLTDPQFAMKFGAFHRQGKMVGTRVTEFMLDPAAPESKGDAAPAANGPGIDAQTLADLRMFVPGKTTKSRRGSGFGLPTVQQYAATHGGGLEIESQPGKGATFTMTLAAKEEDEA
jgi:hypothetical protein